ncbi:MAG: hypothetical protein AVDCRST_MAG45-607, partial [uncultured Solirubrobacterales bacterium]
GPGRRTGSLRDGVEAGAPRSAPPVGAARALVARAASGAVGRPARCRVAAVVTLASLSCPHGRRRLRALSRHAGRPVRRGACRDSAAEAPPSAGTRALHGRRLGGQPRRGSRQLVVAEDARRLRGRPGHRRDRERAWRGVGDARECQAARPRLAPARKDRPRAGVARRDGTASPGAPRGPRPARPGDRGRRRRRGVHEVSEQWTPARGGRRAGARNARRAGL